MGLDITAYRKLKKVENPILDEDGYVEDYEHNWKPGASMDWSESVWPGRGEGVDSQNVYEWEEDFDFRAGSYSGYNWWRSKLEEFASDKDGAFKELIDFADNEGVIGPVVSKKLYEDFKRYEKQAIDFSKTFETDGEYWFSKYKTWMQAFEVASDGGAVDFH